MARTSADDKPTHILVSAKRAGFNRGGFRWFSEPRVLALEEFEHKARELKRSGVHGVERDDAVIAKELINQVMAEPMLVARLITSQEAANYKSLRDRVGSGEISASDLYNVVVRQQEEIEVLRKTIGEIQARMFGGPPPAKAEDLGVDGAPPLKR